MQKEKVVLPKFGPKLIEKLYDESIKRDDEEFLKTGQSEDQWGDNFSREIDDFCLDLDESEGTEDCFKLFAGDTENKRKFNDLVKDINAISKKKMPIYRGIIVTNKNRIKCKNMGTS